MSYSKGNIRTRPQKYQNVSRFQNDKYDSSKHIKTLNSMKITSLCNRCTSIVEWKIQYKKYKPLTVAKKCIKCEGKSVRAAYHNICDTCSERLSICAKCGLELESEEDTEACTVDTNQTRTGTRIR